MITVLVPDDHGRRALEGRPGLRALRYDLESDPGPEEQEAAALVVGMAEDRVDLVTAYLARLPRLRLLQTLNAGYDQWVAGLPSGVALANARGAHGAAVAEWVAAVLLAHSRRLDVFARAQAEGRWQLQLTDSLQGKAVAVLGAGDIGTNVRRLLEPFGASVTLLGRTARDGVRPMAELDAVLGDLDVVVLALPVTEETTGLVDGGFLGRLKDGAVLVNAGRGVLVDTGALLAAMAQGRISAILDVTDPEPLPAGHPLWSAPGVTITPHVAGATPGIWRRAWQVAGDQLETLARGETPANLVVDPEDLRD